MQKITLLLSFILSATLILGGCSNGGGSDDAQTGNRGAPGNALEDDGSGFTVGTEFLSEHDGDGVNPFTAGTLSDDVGLSPGTIVEGCFVSCAFMGVLTKFSPTITLGTPFTIRSVSYYIPTATPPCAPGDAAVTADFVVYEAGSDTPGVEILRVEITAAMANDMTPPAVGGTMMPPLKTYTFSPPLVVTDLFMGDTDGTFFAGIEFMNDTAGTFAFGLDLDPTPFPDPDGPWVGVDPLGAECPVPLPDSVPSAGFVPPTTCLEDETFGFGRGTSFIKCGASTYSMDMTSDPGVPFEPAFDWIMTVEVGP